MTLVLLLLLVGLLFGVGAFLTAAKWLILLAALCWAIGLLTHMNRRSL